MGRSPGGGATALALLLGALGATTLVTLGAVAPAAAHGPDPADGDALEVRLEPLPPELSGVIAQVRSTLGVQIAVENRSNRALEVLDEGGAVLVRIGPRGVEGNLESQAWYRSLVPADLPARIPERLQAQTDDAAARTPRFVRVRREPSWGWFDRRIAPEADRAGEPWEIPVRIGGRPSALRGRFVAPVARSGTPRARMSSDGQLAPGVRVSLLPGRAGSFFLRNDSERTVQVLGRDGEPFLRLGPSGVEANLHSATFAEVANLRGGRGLDLDPRADAAPRWQRLSSVPRYSWVDPRTAWAGAAPPPTAGGAEPEPLLRWSIPVRLGSGEDAPLRRIEGATVWEPFPVRHVDDRHERRGT